MNTFADRIIAFNKQLDFTGDLPDGIRIMNPYKEDEYIIPVSSGFYRKYYNDCKPRHLILGINPGRFGAGVTGIPFTDPKRLIEKCGLEFQGDLKHEPSSVFVYEVIDAFGGATEFYSKFYINSVCPLGFTAPGPNGKEVNYNYYDNTQLTSAVYNFIIDNIQKQIAMGVETDVCFCFGTGKNETFLRKLNDERHFFHKIVALEHPRFVMQYKTKSKQIYIEKYILAFSQMC
ncbi:MAG: uracil-DNA glycosylase family protein [Bacteroidota bacterium]